ncbi:response regulator transcription factor [Alkalihalobacillus sp. BA299]|uniref:response regulator transcription factor n=1 Tax=Alkalihalobacillus sp. BA299 TaxID=2815938 RepID=UPI001ADD4EBD|nr:response regulator transcription factor [Alkalihalobacillus sp. BA299]
MDIQENSVLILDTQNNFDEHSLDNDELKIIGIENNYDESLNILEKSQPEILVKVINDEDGLTLTDTLNYVHDVKKISEDTQLCVVNVESEIDKIHQLISAGVTGLHDGKSDPLIDALKIMKQYKSYLSTVYQKVLLESYRKIPGSNRNAN